MVKHATHATVKTAMVMITAAINAHINLQNTPTLSAYMKTMKKSAAIIVKHQLWSVNAECHYSFL